MIEKMKQGESRYLLAKSKVIADFEAKGQTFKALEQITAALTSNSMQGKNGFRLEVGDTINVIDKKGKEMLFKVFRIVAGLPILIETNSSTKEIGLIDRLHMAWEVFTGKFFKR